MRYVITARASDRGYLDELARRMAASEIAQHESGRFWTLEGWAESFQVQLVAERYASSVMYVDHFEVTRCTVWTLESLQSR